MFILSKNRLVGDFFDVFQSFNPHWRSIYGIKEKLLFQIGCCLKSLGTYWAREEALDEIKDRPNFEIAKETAEGTARKFFPELFPNETSSVFLIKSIGER